MPTKHPLMRTKIKANGLSLVEVVVVSALVAVIFVALTGVAQTMLKLLGQARAESTALALATERLEYIRSLTYDSIGTVSGVPAGSIPQTRTVAGNKNTYNERVLIVYVDDAADGMGAADSNAILEDYKQVKVEYTWSVQGSSHSLVLTSNVVPTGIESTTGGGTIRVNVFDTATNPVAGAAVRFVNTSTSPAIDTTRYTTATGEAYLSGAPASAGYEITVTKTGYSTDGTYTPDAVVPNPNTPPVAVLASQVSTMNFLIDYVSDLKLATRDLPTLATVTDTFTDSSGLSSQNGMEVYGGSLQLASSSGSYLGSGTALGATTSPATIDRWYSLQYEAVVPNLTIIAVSLYTLNAGVPTLVPESDLPGNAIGFGPGALINLEALSGAAYPSLWLGARATTTDPSATPAIHNWSLTYVVSQSAIPNVDLAVRGSKTYGTDASFQPVYQYNLTTTTDATGERTLSVLATDAYYLSVTDAGYSVAELCPTSPLALNPATSVDLTAALVPKEPLALRVVVATPSGTLIPNTSVRLQNSGVDSTKTTSFCGQTFFASGLYSSNTYTVTVSHPAYSTQVISNVNISDDSSVVTVSMVP